MRIAAHLASAAYRIAVAAVEPIAQEIDALITAQRQLSAILNALAIEANVSLGANRSTRAAVIRIVEDIGTFASANSFPGAAFRKPRQHAIAGFAHEPRVTGTIAFPAVFAVRAQIPAYVTTARGTARGLVANDDFFLNLDHLRFFRRLLSTFICAAPEAAGSDGKA